MPKCSRHRTWAIGSILVLGTIAVACDSGNPEAVSAAQAPAAAASTPASGERGGQEVFGPFELVEIWPQPLPDGADGV